MQFDDIAQQLGDGPEERAIFFRKRKSFLRIEGHHQLPQKYADKFEALGLDIEDYLIDIDIQDHRLLPNGLHTADVWEESWNQRWKGFFAEFRTPTRQQVLDFLTRLRKEFFLE